jgi:polyisoprenoid-binding protein YceI
VQKKQLGLASGVLTRWAVVLATVVLFAPSAFAQTTAGQFDLARSRVFVRVGATGRLGHEHAIEGRLKSGSLRLGAAAEAGELVFDMTSFTADTPDARKYVSLGGSTDASTQQQVSATMHGGGVLDIRRHPTATFKVRSAVEVPKKAASDPQSYQLDGEFTLHGATRPLSVTAQAETVQGAVHLHGRFPLRQTQFGIQPYTKFLGAVGVADELNVWGDFWLAGS